MLTYIKDQDIRLADVKYIVNPVNCQGVMGAGLAKALKDVYKNFKAYDAACGSKQLKPGEFVIDQFLFSPTVIHLATKDHWKDPSEILWIEKGIDNLKAFLDTNYDTFFGELTVALPKIGCGLGGLKWIDVSPIIEDAFHDVPYKVVVYL